MAADQQASPSRLTARKKRLLLYLIVVVGIAAWKFVPRPWKPTVTLETPHYIIASTATRPQTEEIGRVVEALYNAYSNRFNTLPLFQREHPKLKLLLYKDRDEMRWINPGLGWAEAFYRKPYCRAYYSAGEINSYHWMVHEAVHQLNEEVSQLKLAKWLDEGVADYFATSRIKNETLQLGRIDPNTYPVWWIEIISTAPGLEQNLTNHSVIPLRAVITDSGGPSMGQNVNLYYLHWWSLAHFIFESDRYREAGTKLMADGGDLQAFERLIGPAETVQVEWHRHVRRLKSALVGNDLEFLRTGELPKDGNAGSIPLQQAK